MTAQTIGKLERVHLREVWATEAQHFTHWLQNNLDILSDALGLDLISVVREHEAGDFSVDLVAEDDSGSKIIIENQLEKSNHDHLGKLITYLAALNARAAVWIVADPRPEHVAAVSWLNDSSSAAFYLVKVEAVRISLSPPAPLLTVIVRPADTKSEIVAANQKFSERHILRKRWWETLITRPQAKLHAHISPSTKTYIGTSSGTRGLNLNYVVLENECGVELHIDRGRDSQDENRLVFNHLFAHKHEIEQAFGAPLDWDCRDGRRACSIGRRIPRGYRADEEEWDEIQQSLVDAMSRFEQALRPHLGTLKISS